MRQLVRILASCRSGATAIEYALIAGLVSIAVIAGATTLGTNLNLKFSAFATKIGTSVP